MEVDGFDSFLGGGDGVVVVGVVDVSVVLSAEGDGVVEVGVAAGGPGVLVV